jgi:hypothetical protein
MKSLTSLATAFVAIALSLGTASASYPVAVYALVDKVVVEPPGTDKPERVQIWGVFVVAKPGETNAFEAPQRGYLYFKLPKDQEEQVRREWADLKGLAGTRQVVGFGNRYANNGCATCPMKARVRKADEKPETPDFFSAGWGGVIKMRSDTDYPPVKSLLEYSDH